MTVHNVSSQPGSTTVLGAPESERLRGELDGFTPWPSDLARLYLERGAWRGLTLPQLLRASAERWPTHVAVADEQQRLTYGELQREISVLARGLAATGLKPRERVILQLPNTVQFVVSLFALLELGAVPVLAIPALRAHEISHIAEKCSASAYLIPDRYAGFDYRKLAAQVVAEVPSIRSVLVVGAPGSYVSIAEVAEIGCREPFGAAVEARASDVAMLLVSGGTTDTPKLICRTHEDFACGVRASSAISQLSQGDVFLAVLSAAHLFTLGAPGIIGALMAGATVVLAKLPTADAAFRLIERERVTLTAVVPSLAQLWVDTVAWDRRERASLRLLIVGGASLSPELARRAREALRCQLQISYGMSEGLLCFTKLSDSSEVVENSGGRPICADDEIRIVDAHGRIVSPGELGELLARGPTTHRGYYRPSAYDAERFTEDGFFRTGDLVRERPDGNLAVEGRVKDIIVRAGENVAAYELETKLMAHANVARAVVVGIPDGLLGERVCAVLIADGEAVDARELKRHLSSLGLATFKLPDDIVFVAEIPLTPMGKIDKKAIRASLMAARRQHGGHLATGRS